METTDEKTKCETGKQCGRFRGSEVWRRVLIAAIQTQFDSLTPQRKHWCSLLTHWRRIREKQFRRLTHRTRDLWEVWPAWNMTRIIRTVDLSLITLPLHVSFNEEVEAAGVNPQSCFQNHIRTICSDLRTETNFCLCSAEMSKCCYLCSKTSSYNVYNTVYMLNVQKHHKR